MSHVLSILIEHVHGCTYHLRLLFTLVIKKYYTTGVTIRNSDKSFYFGKLGSQFQQCDKLILNSIIG